MSLKFETQAIHAGRIHRPSGGITSDLTLATTFMRGAEGDYPYGHIYARASNPNRQALERSLMTLEAGADAVAFASGSAATYAVFQSLAPGEHVIVPDDVYHGTRTQLRELFARWGLTHSVVDLTNVDAVRAALQAQTRLIWIETPSNPLLKISDIRALSELAHEAGAITVVDNTFASPLLQQPLALGADLVLHSTTKYLGGHSDILGGAVIAREADTRLARIRDAQIYGGGVPSPFDCWLLLRSIATLPCRMRTQSANAERLAHFLSEHPAVHAVHYPGLPQHPGHALAQRQMSGYGAMLSVQVRGGAAAAQQVAGAVRIFTRATSLGGVESLIEHRYSVEGPHSTTPPDLLRISVGLEHIDDLLDDMRNALQTVLQ